MRRRATPRVNWSRRRRWLAFSALGLLIAFAAATVRLFVLPARNSPRHADAIVVLGGDGNRLNLGIKLAREGYASTLLVSSSRSDCAPDIPRVRVRCFQPHPKTTQGEARHVAAAARQYGWKHLMVVTSNAQVTRARLRFGRCTSVDIVYVTAHTPTLQWPYRIAYEWGALAKALVWQRSC